MNAAELLQDLQARGIELRAEGERLLCNAPAGAMTEELKQAIAANKAALLEQLAAGGPARPVTGVELRPLPRDGDLPLSFAQQRLWYLDQLEPGASVYNLPFAYRLRGELDAAALEESLNALIARHEVLRTTFDSASGTPRQVTDNDWRLALPVVDVEAPAPETDELPAALYRERVAQPFDLSRGPLLRAQLLRLAPDDHVLLVVVHHIVFDGWSVGVFMRELATCYEAVVAGRTPELPPLPVQYADYAAWQQAWMESDAPAGQLAYWKQQLHGELPVLEMPASHPRPAEQSFRGGSVTLDIPAGLADAVGRVAAGQRVTPFMLLVSVFATLLYRYSGQDDIIVGTPVANRAQPQTAGLIGFLVNTLALRVDLHGEPSFAELLTRVREVCLGAYENQDIPFDRLVAELQPARDLSRTPVFQALFTYEEADREPPRLADLHCTELPVDVDVAHTDLSLWVRNSGQGMRCVLEYSSDLFERDFAARLLRHFGTLLESATAAPQQPIGTLAMLDADERRQLLEAWNDTAAELPSGTCIHDLFLQRAAAQGEAVAVVTADAELSYAELAARSGRLASYLRGRGVGPGSFVAISLERGVDMLVAVLGVLRAGGAYIPLDPDYPVERLAYMLEDSGAGLLLTQASLEERLPAGGVPRVRVDTDRADIDACDDRLQDGPAPEDIAYVIYTSGSTGKPKGVQVPHRCVVNFLLSMARQPGLDADDVLVAVTTLSFDIAVLELYLPLVVGGRIVLADADTARDGMALAALLEASGATVMQATPATWRMLVAAGWQGREGFRALCGGEAMPRELAADLLARCDSLWNLYGPTETTVWSTFHRLTEASDHALIGRPIANTRVYVLDPRGQPLPPGVPGELHIGGAGVTRGYLGRPELTAERFVADPFAGGDARLYRTGDRVRYRDDGVLEYEARMDNQVKLRGFRIEPGEIEAVLGTHEAVAQCVVQVREDRPGDVRLVAYVVPEPGRGLTVTEVRAHLRGFLPEYMVPQQLVELDAFPLTPNGKVDRKALPAPFAVGTARPVAAAEPRTPAERYLLDLWKELLGHERVGVEDNFFEAGGHSLLSMEVIARVRRDTGFSISPRAMILESLATIAAGLPLQEAAEARPAQAGRQEPSGLAGRMKKLFTRSRK
ncbi:MAG TPA: amino acid adenylation domain-containing protein [Gammaproteobacteria bacterium]|nr:amino acid adenylation domain-containing protein [Gammaproteobacteria bacterium]